MLSVPKKIFRILDGTPAVYGQYSRGQSLVELALVTPLLIVLLMGLAEIGAGEGAHSSPSGEREW